MANNLFVSYDLYKPGQNYEGLIDEIKSLGNWAAVHKSLWFVSSNLTASQALERLRLKADSNDKLLVIDAKNNTVAWVTLSDEVSNFIRNNWQQ